MDPDPLAAVRETLATHETQLAAHRGQLRRIERRLADGQIDQVAGRLDDLAATVAAALDAAAPGGPAVPRWDAMDARQRAEELDRLRSWVDTILRPGWCQEGGGAYQLADCWDRHRAAVNELGVLAVLWRAVYAKRRPGPAKDAAEWNDRWLPGVMRRVGEMTRGCGDGSQHFDP